jgi:hypothetical protein
MNFRSPKLLILLGAIATTMSFAGPAAADNVVNDTQIVVGNQCIGAICVNEEVFGASPLMLKTTNTPAIRFNQTNGGGYTAQIWDIGANEANFFVRDNTGGSKLPFRVFPGAETSLIGLRDGGYATSSGQLALETSAHSSVADFNTGNLLTSLRDLPFQTYRSTDSTDSHLRPNPATFAAKFGGSATYLSTSDVASYALAAAQAVNARVDGIPGATDLAPTTNEIAALKAENAKLKKQQSSMSRSLKKLQKQMKKLARKR